MSHPGKTEQPPTQRLGRDDPFAKAKTGCPAGEVVGDDLDRQPGPVGGKLARGQVVQTDTVLEVADGVLDLGVTAVIGLELEHCALAVGDEAVVVAGRKERELGAGRRPGAPDDEPAGDGILLVGEGGVGRLGHVRATVQHSPASAVFSESRSARPIKSIQLPTHLTESNRSAGRDGVRNGPRVENRPVPVMTESACKLCGQVLPNGRDYCDECLPEYRGESARRFGELALERHREQRARGADPTKTREALSKQGARMRANRAAEAEWGRQHPNSPAPEVFTRTILPGLQSVSATALSRATGLSVAWCSRIKQGLDVPHPRHWAVLMSLVGTPL